VKAQDSYLPSFYTRASYPAYYLPTGTNASHKKLCEGRGMGHAYQAAHHELEDGAEDRCPCVEADRARL